MDWNIDSGFQKIVRYCAYQERSRQEIMRKLDGIGCPEDKKEILVEELAAQGFWNEDRYARSFVRGKFRNNAWGKVKIRQGLRMKGVPEDLIQPALDEEIDGDDYQATLMREMGKKWKQDRQGIGAVDRQKLIHAMQSRGFEIQMILEIWDDWVLEDQ